MKITIDSPNLSVVPSAMIYGSTFWNTVHLTRYHGAIIAVNAAMPSDEPIGEYRTTIMLANPTVGDRYRLSHATRLMLAEMTKAIARPLAPRTTRIVTAPDAYAMIYRRPEYVATR